MSATTPEQLARQSDLHRGTRIIENAGRLLTLVEHGLKDCIRQPARIHRLRQSILNWAFEGRLVKNITP